MSPKPLKGFHFIVISGRFPLTLAGSPEPVRLHSLEPARTKTVIFGHLSCAYEIDTLNTVFGSIFYESIFIYKSQKKLWPHCASKLITTKLIVRFTYVIIIIKYAIDDSEWLSEQGTNAQRADIDNRVPYMCVADAKLSAV